MWNCVGRLVMSVGEWVDSAELRAGDCLAGPVTECMVLEKEVRHWWVLVDRHRPHLDHEGRRGVGGGPWHRERPMLGASGHWQG